MAGGQASVARTSAIPLSGGRSIACNGGGGSASIWLVARNTAQPLETATPVHDLVAFANGQRLAGACEEAIRIWDTTTGATVADWDGPEETISTLAGSHDGAYLASSSRIGQDVWIWKTATGEPILIIPDALQGCAIEALAFHPSKNIVAVGGVDHLATGGSNGAISLWDIDQRAEIATFLEGTTALAFAPDGERLVASTLDRTICVWDLAADAMEREFLGHDGLVRCLAVDPSGRWVATGSEDGTIRFWSWEGEELASFEVSSLATSLAVTPDGKTIVVGHANTTASVFAVPSEASRAP